MAGKRKDFASDSEVAYLRSYWDTVAEMEHEFDVWVHVKVVATAQRGVISVEMVADEKVPGPALWHVASLFTSYPTMHSANIAAFLFNQAARLSQMVEEARRQKGT